MTFFTLLICGEVRIVLIYSIVCKMYEWIVKRLKFVFLGSKSPQTILVNEDS
jgi:hypothetical protein